MSHLTRGNYQDSPSRSGLRAPCRELIRFGLRSLSRDLQGSKCHEMRRHRRGRVHRIAPLRAAPGRRTRGHRHRLLHGLLSASDEGAQPVVASRQAALHVSRTRSVARRVAAKWSSDAEWVFHLAAMAGLDPQRGSTSTPTRATTSPRRTGCSKRSRIRPTLERLIYASTSSVYGKYASRRRIAADAAEFAVRHHETRGRATSAASTATSSASRRSCCGSSASTARGSAPRWATTCSSTRS